ncbi:TrbC/VIRB2 family protein [Peptococcaceae bacterium CEB3]|nr:TrbC/VIRB2 family protein [Peptococcaceae bacterium CEB3]
MFAHLFKRSNLRKTSIVVLVVMALLMALPVVALASNTTNTTTNVMAGVQAAISGNSVNGLTTSAQNAGNSVVGFLRTVAIVFVVVMLIVVAYSLIWSPNVKTITDMKGRVGALVLALIVAFMAEQIVGTLMHWLGLKA